MFKVKAEVEGLRSKEMVKRAMDHQKVKETLLNKDKRVQVNEERLKTLAERQRLRGLMALLRLDRR